MLFSDLLEKLPNFRFFGDEGDWINFIGIIIAGLITMLGITITITNNQKIRDEDNKNELLPIVELKIISYSEKTQKIFRKMKFILTKKQKCPKVRTHSKKRNVMFHISPQSIGPGPRRHS